MPAVTVVVAHNCPGCGDKAIKVNSYVLRELTGTSISDNSSLTVEWSFIDCDVAGAQFPPVFTDKVAPNPPAPEPAMSTAMQLGILGYVAKQVVKREPILAPEPEPEPESTVRAQLAVKEKPPPAPQPEPQQVIAKDEPVAAQAQAPQPEPQQVVVKAEPVPAPVTEASSTAPPEVETGGLKVQEAIASSRPFGWPPTPEPEPNGASPEGAGLHQPISMTRSGIRRRRPRNWQG